MGSKRWVACKSDCTISFLYRSADIARYAGWGFSQAFYREKVYETAPTLGFKSLEDFMVNFWASNQRSATSSSSRLHVVTMRRSQNAFRFFVNC